MKIFKSKLEKAKEYLGKIGTKDMRHVNGSLYDHLCHVSKMLELWGCEEDVVLAGLCHSVYNTEYFKGNLIDINSNDIRDLIGEKADDMVREWRVMDRENINTEVKDVVALSHILLANDIDHLSTYNISGAMHSGYKRYGNVHKLLNNKARIELYKIINAHDLDDLSLPKEQIKTSILFTGHSGVSIMNDKLCIAIDPWLYASTRDKPIIEGLDPNQYTVDYMLPESRNSARDISPDIILLSHFHTHHAPLTEIIDFAKIKPIKIICPLIKEIDLLRIKNKMGDYIFGRITFKFLDKDTIINDKINQQDVEIKAFMHQGERGMIHFMYYVKLGDKSLLQIVDANANTDIHSTDFDQSWSRLDDLDVEYLFVGAAAHSTRGCINGVRVIKEYSSITPVQAAKLATRMGVRYASVIGMYNHSVWDDRAERGLPSNESESQFYWALSWLAPAIKVLVLRPGDELN